MRWIKASEKLPKYHKRVNGKVGGRSVIKEAMIFIWGIVCLYTFVGAIHNIQYFDKQWLVNDLFIFIIGFFTIIALFEPNRKQ